MASSKSKRKTPVLFFYVLCLINVSSSIALPVLPEDTSASTTECSPLVCQNSGHQDKKTCKCVCKKFIVKYKFRLSQIKILLLRPAKLFRRLLSKSCKMCRFTGCKLSSSCSNRFMYTKCGNSKHVSS